jgi:hypothetical protein
VQISLVCFALGDRVPLQHTNPRRTDENVRILIAQTQWRRAKSWCSVVQDYTQK